MNDLSQIIETYLDAYRKGVAPQPDVFARQYPECESELLAMLSAIVSMEEFGKTKKIKHLNTLPELPAPETLGEFKIVSRLGAGGMGTVYEALQLSLSRPVAIKILAPIWSSDDDLIKKFEQESQVIARLHHPNIVQVFGAGFERGYHFYVMELIDGKEISQKAIQRCYPAESLSRAVAMLGLQAAQALAYAHACKVLHRDVKPSNILLDQDGSLHVSDFGLATILDENDQALLASRLNFGSLPYMAPECLSGKPPSYASDQYSLGLTLYDLMVGHTSFGSGNPASISDQIRNQQFAAIEKIDENLKQILLKSLRYQPEDRYASLEEMAEDLKRYLNNLPIRARPVSFSQQVWLWAKRRPAIAGLSALVTLLLVAWITSLTTGYLRLEKALKQAEHNAQVADHALSAVFHYSSDLPGTQNTQLLKNLLPYYEMISSQELLADAKIAEANRILGKIALRGGNPQLAESAFKRTLAISGLAGDRNLLASSLQAQGRKEEAQRIWRETSKGSDSEAVKACRALAGPLRPMPGQEDVVPRSGQPQELEHAMDILLGLLKQNPQNPDYRFLLASILSEEPDLAKRLPEKTNKDVGLDMLRQLVAEYPQQPAYRLLLLRLAAKTNLRNEKFLENQPRMVIALQQADELLARWPNEPEVIATAMDVRQKYAVALIQQERKEEAVRLFEKSIGLLESLCRHPDCPPEAREKLINLQLRFFPVLNQMERSKESQLLLQEIDSNLSHYTGRYKADFDAQRLKIKIDIHKN
jgi:serine/threonine protein kinase